MVLNVSFDGVDESKLDDFARCEPGRFHLEVTHFEENDPDHPVSCYVDCVVLAGDPTSEIGKNHREYFSMKQSAMGRFAQFLIACKIITKEQVSAWKSGGKSVNLGPENFVGRQFCGKIVNEEYDGKVRAKLSFNLWALDSRSAQGIPTDAAKAKAFLARYGTKGTAQQAQQQPAVSTQQAPPAPQQPPQQADPFAGSEDLFGA